MAKYPRHGVMVHGAWAASMVHGTANMVKYPRHVVILRGAWALRMVHCMNVPKNTYNLLLEVNVISC